MSEGSPSIQSSKTRDSKFNFVMTLHKKLTVSRVVSLLCLCVHTHRLAPRNSCCHRAGDSVPWLVRRMRRLLATRHLVLCLKMKVRDFSIDIYGGGKLSVERTRLLWSVRWGHPLVRMRESKQGRCMRLANTSLVHVPAAGAARSSRSLLPKRAVMAMAAFGLVGLASVVLSRQGTAVEEQSAELSKQRSGSDQGEVYGRHTYGQRLMAECCCYCVS